MRINSLGGFAYFIAVMRLHPLTRTLSPSGGGEDQGSRACPVRQKNLPQKTPVRERKQTRWGLSAFMRLFLQNSLSSYRASLCWGVALGLFLCMNCYAATGALSKQSPSQELRQRDGAQARASITVADGRLTVNLRQAELREVLSRIGQEAGFSLMMASTAGETISVQFTDMALIQGLRRLLRLASLSYAMVYDAEADPRGGLQELWVFSIGNKGTPDFPTTVARHDAAAVTDPERSEQESSAAKNPLLALFRRQQPDTVPPRPRKLFYAVHEGAATRTDAPTATKSLARRPEQPATQGGRPTAT